MYGTAKTNTAINGWATYDTCTKSTTSWDIYIDNKPVSEIIKEIVSKTIEPEVPIETKTRIEVKDKDIYVKYFKDGHFTHDKCIMPDIKDVKFYNNAVIVMFADNTQTKAVLDSVDSFNLEQGISICITKKLLGDNGSGVYNKLIERAFKIMKRNEKAAKKEEEKKLEEKRKADSAIARYRKRKLKKREEEIERQKEAYIRAMREINGNN